MQPDRLDKESVLRVGEVSAVTGRRIFVSVDTDKNLSELFFDGDILRNIAVGSYVDIRKGFLSLIGRVEGENAQGEDRRPGDPIRSSGQRVLTVVLVGFIDRTGRFFGGTKELPLVGNEAFLLTKEKIAQVHDVAGANTLSLDVARSEYEGFHIALPVDGLLNSHIAIFGNTGSGKSNTLAMIYQEFIGKMRARNEAAFTTNCRVLLLDFNNEYTGDACLSQHKKVFKLSTRNDNGDKIPLPGGITDIEILSILADATEKTQKPFFKRVLALRGKLAASNDPTLYLRNIVRQQVSRILQMADKVRVFQLIDYLRQVLPPPVDEDGLPVELDGDLEWHNQANQYMWNGVYLGQHADQIQNTFLYGHVETLNLTDDPVSGLILLSYVQLIWDVLSNRAQNEHIAPAVMKLISKQADIQKVFDTETNGDLFGGSNVVVIALGDVNLEMKKTIPLLVAKMVYEKHKALGPGHSLNLVIDEAHNILSQESFREAESWKDYRLETFEEIIKEGRKFGVFVTIASQRPNDISHTITSQAHNYFIHRLINDKDLQAIASAVSYIDKITEESIPTLPTGTCIFSGMAGQMPLKLTIKPLDTHLQPKSTTLRFSELVPAI